MRAASQSPESRTVTCCHGEGAVPVCVIFKERGGDTEMGSHVKNMLCVQIVL